MAKETNYADRILKAEVLKSIVEKEIKIGWKPTKKNLPQPYNTTLTAAEAYSIAKNIIQD